MGGERAFSREDLVRFAPRHDTFVGVDSDGCVFDTMAPKQKRCFHGLIVSQWGLERVEKAVRETAEFVNLHSRWRGQNRFVCLVRVLDLLRERPEVEAAGVSVPRLPGLRRWIESGRPLSNAELDQAARASGDPELSAVLAWSEAVNGRIRELLPRATPFRGAVEALRRIHERSDVICVSQTPTEALVREWREAGLRERVSIIAGQELGSKTEHLRLAAAGKYAPDRILMIGDAPGDLRAARDNGVRFYPIDPGAEEAAWARFIGEAYPRFLAGTYDPAYEAERIAQFEALLPESPPWSRPEGGTRA